MMSSVGIAFCSVVSISVSAYSIAAVSVENELHTSKELSLLGVTMYTLSFGVRLRPLLCDHRRHADPCR